jgi:hypothetical protein
MWYMGINRGSDYGNRYDRNRRMNPANQFGQCRPGAPCGWGMLTGQCPNFYSPMRRNRWNAPMPYPREYYDDSIEMNRNAMDNFDNFG